MLIYEIEELAKEDESIKFRPVDAPNVIFKVLDAWFGFYTCEKLGPDKFISTNTLIELYGSRCEYELVTEEG